MAGNLTAIVDYLVTETAAEVGHARVYSRTRSTRNRLEFETLFVGVDGLDFWTVRRNSSEEKHRGASHQATRLHTIQITGAVAAEDQALDGNSREVALQSKIEDLVDRLRQDPDLGGNVEWSNPAASEVQDVTVAGVACYRGVVVVQAREALSW